MNRDLVHNVDGLAIDHCPHCGRAMDKVGGLFPPHSALPGEDMPACKGPRKKSVVIQFTQPRKD